MMCLLLTDDGLSRTEIIVIATVVPAGLLILIVTITCCGQLLVTSTFIAVY